jgi:REP element-mobilizing transposase RayT
MENGSRIKEVRRKVLHGKTAVYHSMGRTVRMQHWLGDDEKDSWVHLMRRQAAFCGIEVLAYCVMSNHFHLLIRVPHEAELSDGELLRRHREMYRGDRLGPRAVKLDQLERLFAEGGEEADRWRQRLKARMGDVSVFMRELKQHFGIWFNRRHANRGSIWADRFRSLLVEDDVKPLAALAAYIDLSAVRAELVSDPSAYRFCSYGAALDGQAEAVAGYEKIFRCQWTEANRLYLPCLRGTEG